MVQDLHHGTRALGFCICLGLPCSPHPTIQFQHRPRLTAAQFTSPQWTQHHLRVLNIKTRKMGGDPLHIFSPFVNTTQEIHRERPRTESAGTNISAPKCKPQLGQPHSLSAPALYCQTLEPPGYNSVLSTD